MGSRGSGLLCGRWAFGVKKTARWAVFSRMGSKLCLRLTDDLRSKEETLNPGFKGLLLAAKKEQVHLHLFSFATMREMGLLLFPLI